MKTVALCHHYSLTFHGGGERFLIDVASQLIKTGHKVAIHALPFGRRPVKTERLPREVRYKENFIHKIQDADVMYFIYAPLVHKLFMGESPKIGALHAFVFLNELQSTEIRNMGYVNFLKGFGFSKFASKIYFDKFRERELRSFDAIHVINKEAIKILSGEKQVYYVPNWIDTSRFKPLEEKNVRFTVLYSGRRSKGFSTFVEIASLLGTKDIDFIAVGPDLMNTGNVKNLGFITDVEKLVRLYSKVHLLVYTSMVDVFPLTLLEASACKTPIVSLPTKAIRGLDLPVLHATSVKDFAHVIRKLQNMWEKRREQYLKLCERMRLEVVKYDVKEVFPKFLDMLKEVASLS
ncbi:MAG: glycosyltransferase family 4 protein [Candidatus Bathyarchaeota archaeon]|nr:glycosyltransferase family 4 protein [Candidatus Bathyarchaeota archaeon A05DMB-3]MDH7607363.1 glycosyltransferase family 4 protein [Candidatus Bathyarchaeota archaeon]